MDLICSRPTFLSIDFLMAFASMLAVSFNCNDRFTTLESIERISYMHSLRRAVGIVILFVTA